MLNDQDMLEQLEKYPNDVYLYYGAINRRGYHALSNCLEDRLQKKKGASLILITLGGDPDAGYRIARSLRHHYDSFEVIIPDLCKSAGTLICIGADLLIFGDRGELGPLDIQLSKPDELFESMSGLDIIQALVALESRVIESFRSYLVDIRKGSGLRTKMAADIAAKLTEDFIAPIASKIDPVTLGEHQRAMQIAQDYGRRLNQMSLCLHNNALTRLIAEYSSHGFVIDRKEARELFKRVKRPDDQSLLLINWTRNLVQNRSIPTDPTVIDLKKYFHESVQERTKNESASNTCDADKQRQTVVTPDSVAEGTRDKQTGRAPKPNKGKNPKQGTAA